MGGTDLRDKALLARFDESEQAVLLERAPVAAMVMLAAYAAFALGDWFLSPAHLATLWAMKAVAGATLGAMTLFLRTSTGARFVGLLSVLGAYVGLGSIVAQSNAIGDAAVVPTVATFGSLVLSALLPWKFRHQAWFVAAVPVALVDNAWSVGRDPGSYAVLSSAICSLASVPLTQYFRRARYRLWLARFELEESHRALQESEERFRQVADNSREIIWIWNKDLSIDYVSPAVSVLPGWTQERILERPGAFLEMIHPDERRGVAKTLQRISSGETAGYEGRLVSADGLVERFYQGWGGPVRDQDGSILRYVGIWHDITARKKAEEELLAAKEQSDELLRNVFPGSVAERVKREGARSIVDRLPDVTILFADVVGFTPLTERLGPRRLLELMNDLFSEFDDLTERFGVEKLETIGDGYLAVGGAPEDLDDHAHCVARLALAMVEAARARSTTRDNLDVRIGIHTGPVLGGVVGRKRLHYSLFGETINVAARLQARSEPGRVLVSDTASKRLRGEFELVPNDVLDLRGHGPMQSWWLGSPTAPSSLPVAP